MGGRISPSNPNICRSCEDVFWVQVRPIDVAHLQIRAAQGSDLQTDSLSELNHLLKLEKPTVMEVLAAEMDAQQAIAEINEKERKGSSAISTPALPH